MESLVFPLQETCRQGRLDSCAVHVALEQEVHRMWTA